MNTIETSGNGRVVRSAHTAQRGRGSGWGDSAIFAGHLGAGLTRSGLKSAFVLRAISVHASRALPSTIARNEALPTVSL